MNFVIPNYRVAPRPDLYPGQRVAMDIVALQDATPTTKEVDSALKPSKYLVVTKGGVTLASYPYSGIRVGKYLVLYELATPLNKGNHRNQ